MPANGRYPQGYQQFEYTPLSFKVMKDLKQAVTMYGIQSNYVKGLLQGLAQEYGLIPYDWGMSARTVLSSGRICNLKHGGETRRSRWQGETRPINYQ